MLSKVNLKRVAVTAFGLFAVAFVATAAKLPSLIGAGDWSAVKDLAYSASLAGVGAVVEGVFHITTKGFGDPTAK